MPVTAGAEGRESVTNPSHGAENQPNQDVGAQPGATAGPPPDRSWIEFDVGLRNQDPEAIERRVIERGD
jgi:hypothetical protein